MLQAHLGDCLCDTGWLLDVVLRGTTVRDGAIGAVSRADVAENHERRGAVFPALANVRTMGLLAYGMEVHVAHHLLESQVVRPARCLDLEPRRLALRQGLHAVAAHDLV